MILVSACLLGINTKYNGGSNPVQKLIEMCKTGEIIPVCPEQLGGLSSPRVPSEIVGGDGVDVLTGKARVMAKDGMDITDSFVKGAKEVLKIAKLFDVNMAILKERSPSCGCNAIYDGTFSGGKKSGSGVTAALLRENGIEVFTEEDYDEYDLFE